MNTYKLSCPSCDAELSPVDGIDTFYCQFCGAKIVLEGISDEGYRSKVKIKEFEHVERVKDRQYAHEERLQREQHDYELHKMSEKNRVRVAASKYKTIEALLPVLIIGAVILMFLFGFGPSYLEHKALERKLVKLEKEIEESILNEEYDIAEIKANQIRIDEDWSSEFTKTWNDKREYYFALIEEKKGEQYAAQGMLPVPAPSNYLEGKNYYTAENIFKDAGFKYVECVPSSEKSGFFTSTDSVEHISINGAVKFDTTMYFDKDAKVIIYYYK